jgi:hypothetical protein
MLINRTGAALPEETIPVDATRPEHDPEEAILVDATRPENDSEEGILVDATRPENGSEETILVEPMRPEYDDDIFGPPPLAQGEDPRLYKAMLTALTAGVHPKDIIEQFLVRDVVYLVLEVQRLRRIKANIPITGMVDGLRKILNNIDPALNNLQLAEHWAVGEPEAVGQVERLLSKAGVTKESIALEAFIFRLPEIERVDHMIAMAEARRAAALREIDRHRKALADELEIGIERFERAQVDYVPDPHARRRGQ